MKTVYLLQTVVGDAGTLAADQEHAFEDAEADRLIAIGAAVDPSLRVVPAQEPVVPAEAHVAVVAERDALAADLSTAEASLATANAALAEAHAEIDRLTKALAAAEKKAK